MSNAKNTIGFHEQASAYEVGMVSLGHWDTQFTYTFENFFHPFVGQLLSKLNRDSLAGMMDATWQDKLATPFFKSFYKPTDDNLVHVAYSPKEIDLDEHGPYANYNWELFFHIPVTVATHLSKTQRFAEAQRWFHYVFDPTSNDQSVDPPARFWKFLAFRKEHGAKRIDELLALLSKSPAELSDDDKKLRQDVLDGYDAILNKPFMPHAVARTRHVAYQYSVVMKYLDNLIAWGDSLFQQDTLESINEATQLYVLAANILGPRPQKIPPRGTVQAKTFAQLKARPHDVLGNALVELEGQFPFNFGSPSQALGDGGSSAPLFGIGQTVYFSIPANSKLLGYWDIVADRLFKIRNGMNIAGVVRPLALFDPPIDPAMLVKAAAAGIDIGSIISGLNQAAGPLRSLPLIQKALELCNEVRSLGSSFLAALEKGDAEHLSLIRQRHEIQIQQMTQEVRFLQWKSAQESTRSLLTSRTTALERYKYYQRLLGAPADPNVPDTVTLDRRSLSEENFDEAYASLVGQYDKALTMQKLPPLKIAGGNSPSQQSGASGAGRLFLNTDENADLNVHGPNARSLHHAAMINDTISAGLSMIPDVGVDFHWWGLGGHMIVFGGSLLAASGRFVSSNLNVASALEDAQAVAASKTASYERRADDWMLQFNLAAHELMQNGRQILTALIAEQIANHDYLTVKQQIVNSQEVHQFMQDRFTNEDLYLWMQGEISKLFYEYYRFAFDTARKAEKTMKQELMRPEIDAQDFVKFNYWDGGRKGLLSGEALHLDVKRMEMAYHDNNKRELELTRHISLRQLNPLALLALRANGTCTFSVPEWLYDRDCPGHYMRRIKSVGVSVPSVVGPYTSVHCTLSLLKSSVRISPIPNGGEYLRQGVEDDRFRDYAGAVQSIVTSTGNNDSGLFETNLRDERFLPFEGTGAVSTWKLDLAKDYRAFDYSTISDVILHVRYTARQGVDATKVKTALDDLFQQPAPDGAELALLFSLRSEFPTEWSSFVNGTDFTASIRQQFFPYFVQGKAITITGLDLYAADPKKHRAIGDVTAATTDLADKQAFTVVAAPDQVLPRAAKVQVFLVVRYTL